MNYTLAHLFKGNEQVDPTALYVERALSDQCFPALATSYFGSEHREKAVLEQGLQRYGSALKDLNTALGDLERCKTYDVLEAVTLMSLFEVRLSR